MKLAKLLGLIGGISPESTAIYYRLLNAHARARIGGAHTARLLIWSFDFDLIDAAYAAEDWDRYRALVVDAGLALARGGVDALMICSNTTHLAAEALHAATDLPVIHVIDALAAAIRATAVRRPLLLGTPFVMDGPFYRTDLQARFGITTVIPPMDDGEEIRRIIFEELVRGEVKDTSRVRILRMIDDAGGRGADGVILGCTELSMILSQNDTELAVFDTTAIHAAAASAFAFGEAQG